jgi:hypothetical protein
MLNITHKHYLFVSKNKNISYIYDIYNKWMINNMSLVITLNDEENLTIGEKYTLEQKIKKNLNFEEYSDTYVYVQQTINNIRPDFVLVNKLYGINIIEVKDWSDSYIDNINYKHVSTTDKRLHKNPILQLKQYRNAIESNICNINDFMNNFGNCNIPIRMMLFFPYLSEEKISEYHRFLSSDDIAVFGKAKIRTISIDDFFLKSTTSLTEREFDVLRSAIFPENQLPMINTLNPDEIISLVDVKALDKEQEEFAKKIPNGHYLVTGLPGSGKTVMLITRAIFLLKAKNKEKILILTFTNALSDKLNEQLSDKLEELQLPKELKDNIEIMTFHKLCYNLIGRPKQPSDISKAEYWSDYLPNKALLISKSIKDNDKYHHILIDEYQDFQLNWFELVKSMCIKENNIENIFLAGDRLQQIYQSKWTSFKDIGINIVGRSKLLKNAYRTNKGHLDLALRFLSNNETLKRDVKNFYELDTEEFNYDCNNIRFSVCSDSDLLKKIHHLIIKNNITPKEVLILKHSEIGIKDFKLLLNNDVLYKNTIGLCTFLTYHKAKGFESKYCILCDVDKFKDTIMHRKILFVGMTRASKQLIFCANEKIGFMDELLTHIKSGSEITA